MKKLTDIKTFGAISAEDDDLLKYFVRTPVYEAAKNGECQLIIGRKGAGKSALYLSLLQDSDLHLSRGLSFEDYPWSLHYKYSASLGDRQERFVASWKFLIYIEAFKTILTDPHVMSRYTRPQERDALDAVSKFITENWGTVSFDFKKTFPSSGYKLSSIQFAPKAYGFELGSITAAPGDASNLGDSLARLNDWMWNCLKGLGSSVPTIHLLFDELDRGFDPQSADYIERQVGLLLAVRSLHRDFSRAKLRIFPIVFLRTDIFDALHFGDKNKLSENNATILKWNEDFSYHDCSLKQLVDHRIQEEMEINPQSGDPWSAAFDAAIMRGSQHKFHHMTFRTYMRPRDIIKFANCALAQAQRRLRMNPEGNPKISNDDINHARRDYSTYLIQELDDEINPTYPDWRIYCEILRKIGTERFSYKAFSDAHVALKPTLGLSLPADGVLRMFYEYSVIGFEKVRPAGSGFYSHFRYIDETIPLDLTSKQFQVHRGLKQALNLKEGED